jgi:hypothetical protein
MKYIAEAHLLVELRANARTKLNPTISTNPRRAKQATTITIHPGQRLIINFWGSTASPCQNEERCTLEQLPNELQSNNGHAIPTSWHIRDPRIPIPPNELLDRVLSSPRANARKGQFKTYLLTQSAIGLREKLNSTLATYPLASQVEQLLRLAAALNLAASPDNTKALTRIHKIIQRAVRTDFEGERTTAFNIAISQLCSLTNVGSVKPNKQ